MGFFKTLSFTLSNLREAAMEYVETEIALLKLQAARKISALMSTVIAYAILSVFVLLFLLFGSIAAAYALSDWIGKTYAGFLIVGGFYLLLGCFIFLGRERFLRRPILNSIIRQLFKDNPAENKQDAPPGQPRDN